jgi:large subunit ribosomal protein L7/L12
MSLSTEEISEALGNLTVLQMCELTRTLEAQWGVKAVPQVVQTVPGVPLTTTPVVDEQTEFEIVLEALEATGKMNAIKLVREVVGLGLKEAKDMIEALPKTLKTDVAKAEALDIKARFEAVGVKVTLK